MIIIVAKDAPNHSTRVTFNYQIPFLFAGRKSKYYGLIIKSPCAYTCNCFLSIDYNLNF